MGPAEIIAWASLRRRPARTLFSVLGVALGIAVVVSVRVVDYTSIQHARPDRAGGWRADLEVRPSPRVADPAAELAAMEGVLRYTQVLQGEAEVRGLAAGAGEPGSARGVALLGLEEAAFEMGIVRAEGGVERDALAGGSQRVLIGRTLAERAGVGAGDFLLVEPPRRAPIIDCVEGRLVERSRGPDPRPVRFLIDGILAYEHAGRTADGSVVVLHVDDARRLLAGLFHSPAYWVARDEGIAIERLQAGLREGFAVDLRRGAVVGQQADEVAFRNGVQLAGLLALALGLYVIFHTLSMSLIERAREMATLQALGASRAQIGQTVFTEAAVVAALAGVVGLLGGLGLAKLMLMNSLSSLGVTDSVRAHFEVPWGDILILTAIGVLIALLGSVSPLLRARRADVVQALRGEDGGAPAVAPRAFRLAVFLLVIAALPGVYFLSVPLVGEAEREFVGLVLLGLGVLALLVGTPLLVPGPVGLAARRLAAPLARISPFSGLLAARSISLSPTRVAACVASIALVTAAFVGLRGITSSLSLEVEQWADEGVAGKVWATGLPEVPVAKLADGLRGRGLVQAVEPLDTRLTAPFRIVGLPPEELLLHGPLRDDPELLRTLRTRPSLLVTKRLASQRRLEIGQSVPVATPSAGVVPFEVVGISDAYGYSFQPHERAYAVVADNHLERLFCLDIAHTREVALVLAPGVGVGRLRDGLVQELRALGAPEPADLALRGGWEIRDYELFDIRRDFLLFDVILVLTLLLAGTGVLNGLLLSAMERVKELGVLRALGADFRQIARAVLLEAGFIGATGAVLGLLLGVLLVPVVVAALRVLSGLDLPQPGFRTAFLLGPVLGVAIAFVGGLYPFGRLGRLDGVRAVRTG